MGYSDEELNRLMRPPKICPCRNVSEQDIHEAVKNGKKRFGQIIKMTDAATGCHTCYNDVKRVFEDAIVKYPPED